MSEDVVMIGNVELPLPALTYPVVPNYPRSNIGPSLVLAVDAVAETGRIAFGHFLFPDHFVLGRDKFTGQLVESVFFHGSDEIAYALNELSWCSRGGPLSEFGTVIGMLRVEIEALRRMERLAPSDIIPTASEWKTRFEREGFQALHLREHRIEGGQPETALRPFHLMAMVTIRELLIAAAERDGAST